MREIYYTIPAKGDDWLKVADIIFPMFGKRGDGCMFSDAKEHRIYLNGNHAFVVRVISALRNNGYVGYLSEDV